MKKRSLVCTVVAVIGVMLGVEAKGQDPAQVGPEIYKALFENDRVRAFDVRFKPGDKIATHAHPDHLLFILEAGKLKLTYPDGKSKDLEGKVSQAIWIPAETHAAENTGTTIFHGLVVELKETAKPPMPPVTPPTPPPHGLPDALKSAPETTKVLLENERVRVVEIRMAAGGKSAMHAHPTAFLVYGVTDGKFLFTFPDGKQLERELKAGQVAWSEPMTHAVENVGTAESVHLNVELKNPIKAEPSTGDPNPNPSRK